MPGRPKHRGTPLVGRGSRGVFCGSHPEPDPTGLVVPKGWRYLGPSSYHEKYGCSHTKTTLLAREAQGFWWWTEGPWYGFLICFFLYADVLGWGKKSSNWSSVRRSSGTWARPTWAMENIGLFGCALQLPRSRTTKHWAESVESESSPQERPRWNHARLDQATEYLWPVLFFVRSDQSLLEDDHSSCGHENCLLMFQWSYDQKVRTGTGGSPPLLYDERGSWPYTTFGAIGRYVTKGIARFGAIGRNPKIKALDFQKHWKHGWPGFCSVKSL